MAKSKEPVFNYDDLSEMQKLHIQDYYNTALEEGRLPERIKSFEDFVRQENYVLSLLFVTPEPQFTSYGHKYTIRTAAEEHHSELKINNETVDLNTFEHEVDKFENFIYSFSSDIANVRYHPQMTISQNIYKLNLPTDADYEEMEDMSIQELKEYLKENFDVDVYDSPTGKKK